ncbi:DUF445 domain-containing protein [Nocardioides massiliensis]|uniref:Uncharacterized membrane-anchored protein YjiN (DUF445 family) n=1 Tax=Nocardioides massiliensis TaxID=1325935 RepID=A0ABT9NTY7_9ACTN|nr:DUF445 domain-containing protein [Nocardioides massiliensis]MDP9823887.1 uncharacterized membrane-anchored protein YjiN (DUF445 family) [Nocardioides massiliensis]
MSIPLVAGDPAAEQERRRALRRMRAVASSLLVIAAIVYVLTHGDGGAWGYVNAAAEASMVGAIADWFAVTALFRHPLGIPIPHTALIPRKKEMLGRGLEEFVGENFLHAGIVRERVESAEVTVRVGRWLREERHARRVVDEAATLVHLGLTKVRDDDVRALVEEAILPRLRSEPISPVAGSLLAEVVRDGAHHGLVDLVVEEGYRWLTLHGDTFTDVIAERAPWWAPERLNDAVTRRLHTEAVRWMADIRDDPRHSARLALDSLLAQLATDLLEDAETQERAERLKERILAQPALVDSGLSLWTGLRTALRDALEDPEGAVRRRALTEVQRFGELLVTDAALRERFDRRVADAAVFAIERYGSELTTVITTTIEKWDGDEAARKIELHVGRDLQFIRINGTVVGGLVGLLIHAISEVL